MNIYICLCVENPSLGLHLLFLKTFMSKDFSYDFLIGLHMVYGEEDQLDFSEEPWQNEIVFSNLRQFSPIRIPVRLVAC